MLEAKEIFNSGFTARDLRDALRDRSIFTDYWFSYDLSEDDEDEVEELIEEVESIESDIDNYVDRAFERMQDFCEDNDKKLSYDMIESILEEAVNIYTEWEGEEPNNDVENIMERKIMEILEEEIS